MKLRNDRTVGDGQPPSPIASPGACPPRSGTTSLQGNADVDVSHSSNGGATRSSSACGSSVPVSTDSQSVLIPVSNSSSHGNSHGNSQSNLNANISKCGGRGCKTCPILNVSPYFHSTNTNQKYYTYSADSNNLSCHSTNVIYLLTCNTCKIQYIGETMQPHLSYRISSHRRSTLSESDTGCRYVRSHFYDGPCKDSLFSVNIIEKLNGTGRNSDGSENIEATAYRRERERWWIRELRTIYPYGLNIKVDSHLYNSSNLHSSRFSSYNTFNKYINHTTKRKRGKRNPKCSNSKSVNDLNVMGLKLFSFSSCCLPVAFKMCRSIIFSISLKYMKTLVDILNKLRLDHVDNSSHFAHFYDILLDLIYSRLYKNIDKNIKKNKKKISSNFLKIHFDNKAIELINVSRILHLKEIVSSFPFPIKNRSVDIPTVIYTYGVPIRSKVLNYNNILADFKIDQLGIDLHGFPIFEDCNCSDSPYKDDYWGHIITGDLSIINNNRLRNLLSKGPNYREHSPINWQKAREIIKSALDCLIEDLSNKKHLPNCTFNHFSVTFMANIDLQISLCSRRYHHNNENFIPVLKDHSVLAALDDIHSKFVLTNVDKASKNIAIICKSFYLKCIFNELFQFQNSIHSDSVFANLFSDEIPTYSLNYVNNHEIIKNHFEFMKKDIKLNSICFDDFNRLPIIYMIPKFHKNPIKFRFIVASRGSSLKPLASALGLGLKEIRIQRKFYCQKLLQYDGINRYWVIDSSQPIINCVTELNESYNIKSIATYDFSELYTSLPHDEIYINLSNIIENVFNYRDRKGLPTKLCIYKSNKDDKIWSTTRWVKRPRVGTFYFTKDSMLEGLKYQLSNTSFTFGGWVFNQNCGIPMGVDDGPEIANLNLHQLEYQFLNELKKIDIYQARKLSFTFRFIDDISSFNSNDYIIENASRIYGNSVKLNKENDGLLCANVLDLTIMINPVSKHCSTCLFDKRRAFDFPIVNYPDLSGNISSKMSYGIINSQLLRFFKCCSELDDFIFNCNIFFVCLLEKGFKQHSIEDRFKSFLKDHKPHIKYSVNSAYSIFESVMGHVSGCSVSVSPRP